MKIILALLICTAALGVRAEPLAESEDALRKRDVAGALRILEEAAAGGNVAAKGRLASYLRTLPPPHRDWERACALAREASAAGDGIGAITRAECLIAGTEKAEQPFVLARELARNALKSGVPPAGFTLYMAYALDPKYRYHGQDGKPDSAKYQALAALPLAARGEQIEAFNGLAQAVTAGHVNAALVAITYLAESSAPETIDRVVNLAAILNKFGVQLTEHVTATVRVAQEIRRFGKTHASVSAFRNAFTSAMTSAVIQIRALDEKSPCDPKEIKRFGKTHASVSAFRNAYTSAMTSAVIQIRGLDEKSPCDPKEIKLTQVAAEPVTNAEYLPIAKGPLANTYLLRGSWIESWTFTGCQQTVAVRLTFAADGWSGAHFGTTIGPKAK